MSRTDIQPLPCAEDGAPDSTSVPDAKGAGTIEGPLNCAQQRLWYLYLTAVDRHQFNLVLTFNLRGLVDKQRLNQAINGLLMRHSALRSRIESTGKGWQVVLPPQPAALTESDLTEVPPAEQEAVVSRYQQKELHEPFDLTESTAPRWQLFKRAADSYQLVMSVHHIVFDGLSFLATAKTLGALYTNADLAGDSSVPPGPGLIDHALQEQAEEALQGWQPSLSYWRERLRDFPSHLSLPIANAAEDSTGSFEVTLDAKRLKRVQKWAHSQGVSFFVALKAAFDLALFHHSRQARFLVGTDIAGRPLPEFADTVGFFINQVPLPCEIEPAMPVANWLKQVSDDIHLALEHRHLPFNRLVSVQVTDRNQACSPLFQVKMNYQKRRFQGIQFGEAELTGDQVHQHTGPFYLVLDLVHHEGGLAADFEYQERFFNAQKVQLMATRWLHTLEHFDDLIRGTLADADTLLAQWGREALSAQQRDAQHQPRPKLKRRRAN